MYKWINLKAKEEFLEKEERRKKRVERESTKK
jgi:hypothetical protein